MSAKMREACAKGLMYKGEVVNMDKNQDEGGEELNDGFHGVDTRPRWIGHGEATRCEYRETVQMLVLGVREDDGGQDGGVHLVQAHIRGFVASFESR
jgi:hypothetical protein